MKFLKEIKIIGLYLEPYKKKVFLIGSVAVLASLISAAIPYLYGRLVDIAIKESSTLKIIGAILLLWLILSLIGDWLSRISGFRGYEIGIEAGNDLISETSGHLLDLPISFHKHKKMGEIVQRISRAADYLENIIGNVIFSICPSFLTVIGALAIMAFVEWRLSLILLLVLSLYSLISIWKTKPIIKEQKKINKAYERAYGDIYDSVGNIQTVKSCVREKAEKKKIAKNFKKTLFQRFKSSFRFWRVLNAWQETVFSVGFVLIFASAVLLLRQKTITAGELVMFIGYVSMAYRPFGVIAGYYRQIRNGLTAIDRARKILKVKKEPYREEKEELKNIKGTVEFSNVSFSYQKGKGVLSEINFKVKAGQMLALVGESGVGKTTLCDLLSGYYAPKKGKILIDGRDIAKISLKSLRENIAIVPQEVTLFNDTIMNNIRYGRVGATKEEVIKAAKISHAHKFIRKFSKKYNQVVGERGIKLSTGQKQRVAIARAILRNPKILILDEATSSLDSATEKLVQDALARLIKGRTTFVIAHRLSTIREADKIIVLGKGRIIEEGDHQELIEKGGVYKELCKLQSTVVR